MKILSRTTSFALAVALSTVTATPSRADLLEDIAEQFGIVVDKTIHRVQLLEISSDAVEGVFQLAARLDENGDLVGVDFDRPISLDEINSGVVLMHDDDHDVDVIRLKGDGVSAREGGPLTLSYLSNALTGSRGTFRMRLERIASVWILYTDAKNGHYPFSKMFLKKKTFFGQTIGIGSVAVR